MELLHHTAPRFINLLPVRREGNSTFYFILIHRKELALLYQKAPWII
jgi:hypothetical protein